MKLSHEWFSVFSWMGKRQPALFFIKSFVALLFFMALPGLLSGNCPWYCIQGRLVIEGESNVGKYQLQAFVNHKIIGDSLNDEIILEIPVSTFKGNIPGMLRDFRSILKWKQYPNIIIKVPCNPYGRFTSQGDVQTWITGKCLNLPVESPLTSKSSLQDFSIEKIISLEDLGLYRGERIRGFITLRDKIKVTFACRVLLLDN